MTTSTALAAQIIQNELTWNALNPGYQAPLVQSLDWSGVTFAGYALTLGSTTGLGADLPTVSTPTALYPNPPPASPGNPAAFITGLFENAVGRAPVAADLAYYSAEIAADPVNGYATVLLGIASSPESYHHNHGLVAVTV
jgi:hypothetical protein